MEFSLIIVAASTTRYDGDWPYIIFLIVSLPIALFLLEYFMRRRRRISKRDLAFVAAEWESLRRRVEKEPRHAVLEADKLLDFVLKKRGYEGTLGEKLKKAEGEFLRIDDVWNAHKLRNSVAHEVGFEVTEQEARKALSAFKQALFDLGIKNL